VSTKRSTTSNSMRFAGRSGVAVRSGTRIGWSRSPVNWTSKRRYEHADARKTVHPTEACADPGIKVFQGMAPVSHDLMRNRPRRTEIRRGPSAPWAHRFCRKTLATERSLVEWHLCRARLRLFRLTLSTSIHTQAPISLDTGVMPGKPPAHAAAG